MNKNNLSYYVFGGLIAIYIAESILAPTPRDTLVKYHLSIAQGRALDLSILLPVVLIYFLALLGYVSLIRYCNLIRRSKDGRAFTKIAHGLMALAFGLPVIAIVDTALSWIAFYHSGFLPASVIMTNYFSLIVPLTAFLFISRGVYELTLQAKLQLTLNHIRLLALVLVLLGTSYTYLTFRMTSTIFLGVAPNPKIFYLPSWLILFTIIVPYVLLWSIGLLSVIQVGLYNYHVKGIIYRKALIQLTAGLGIVLLCYVVIEYLSTLTSGLLKVDDFGWLLAIVYAFLLLLGVGYLLIALGSGRLKRIEDV